MCFASFLFHYQVLYRIHCSCEYQAAIPIRDTFSDNIVMQEFRVKTILQWNPVNAVINGPKKLGRFNGVAVLPGQDQIS